MKDRIKHIISENYNDLILDEGVGDFFNRVKGYFTPEEESEFDVFDMSDDEYESVYGHHPNDYGNDSGEQEQNEKPIKPIWKLYYIDNLKGSTKEINTARKNMSQKQALSELEYQRFNFRDKYPGIIITKITEEPDKAYFRAYYDPSKTIKKANITVKVIKVTPQ